MYILLLHEFIILFISSILLSQFSLTSLADFELQNLIPPKFLGYYLFPIFKLCPGCCSLSFREPIRIACVISLFNFNHDIGVSRGGGGQGVLTRPFPGPPLFICDPPPSHPTRSHSRRTILIHIVFLFLN